MRLSNTAILVIRGLGPDEKDKLAEALGISTRTLYRYMEDNDDALTKAAGLKFLKNLTGLTDADLLEEINETTQQN